jgi:Protein of unknown function (DUF3515)
VSVFPDLSARPAGTPRWPLGVALALVLALVVGVLIAASMVRNRSLEPLRLAVVPAPAADSADCVRLLAALPEKLDGGELGALERRQLHVPVPASAAAWGEPPVVLRCGLGRPADLTPTSRLLSVSGVQFLEIQGNGMNTWVAVDRPVYVAVALPSTIGSAPLQQITTVISKTLPRQDVNIPH